MRGDSKLLMGAAIGGVAAGGGTVAANYFLPVGEVDKPSPKRFAAVVGLGTGLLAAAVLWFTKNKAGAVHAALTSVLVTAPRIAEVFALPKPQGGRDLGAITVDELKAVVAGELRGAQNDAGGRINLPLSSAFGSVPLVNAR